MSGGTITRHECGRLIILGQRCVCDPIPERECDCRTDGNRQVLGPTCRERIDRAWGAVARHTAREWLADHADD